MMSARELALRFCCALQAHPDLIGGRLRSDWIERFGYPLFCGSLGVIDPPAFDSFARELAAIMPRKRKDSRPGHAYRKRKGRTKRTPTPTPTFYVIPAPLAQAAVIDLAERKCA
jgi:hypothetical protein